MLVYCLRLGLANASSPHPRTGIVTGMAGGVTTS